MGLDTDFNDLFQGFSKLDREERYKRLLQMGAVSPEDVRFLQAGTPVPFSLAEKFIENVIGFFQLPMGVATNFVVDGKPKIIPMAVEETSIIAAASKTAKWVREHGQITTEMRGREIIGQIQIAKLKDPQNFKNKIESRQEEWIDLVNREVAAGMVRRGGGVTRLEVRQIPRGDGLIMGIIHVLADPCDAMGANIINQVCEFLKRPIEDESGETVTMCILSNLVDSRLTQARVEMRGLEPELMEKIEEASLFAQLDPYRAATNNKGVLNGIDPILIATGNDWRAVEAGVHAYACETGQYRSITKWRREGSSLVGEFLAPVVLGIVGGVTTLHPTAKLALGMLDVESAEELSRLCAAVGLVQNLGALRALTTVGIIEGHMKLHIKNLTLGAGAEEKEIPLVQRRLEEILSLHKRISLSHAVEVLRELRAERARDLS
ncbi:MAG: hydroxymethylglutaryl-CoA reductase, degradative [Bdellovibrionales bacterium]